MPLQFDEMQDTQVIRRLEQYYRASTAPFFLSSRREGGAMKQTNGNNDRRNMNTCLLTHPYMRKT